MENYEFPKIKFYDYESAQEIFYEDYLKKNFTLPELFNQRIIDNYGILSLQLVDLRILKFLYSVRLFFNTPVYVNYPNDKKLKLFNRLIRFPDCSDYNMTSQHSIVIEADGKIQKKSTGIDFDVKGLTADKVRKEICNNKDYKDFTYITRMEDRVSWVHADCKPTSKDRIYLFKV